MAGTVGVAPGTYTFTLNTGQTLSIEDWIDDKLYSTVQLQNGQNAQVEAFTLGRGQAISGGTRPTTKVDTNIPRAGDSGLPLAWEMFIYGLGIMSTRVCRPPTGLVQPVLQDGAGALSDPAMLQTLFNVDRVTFVAFFYNTRFYTEGVMQDYPQGHGFSVFSTQPAFEIAQNGVPSPRDRNALVLPIWLREQIIYKMIISPEVALVINQPASDGGANLTFMDLKIAAFGLIKRSAGL
jgi:hypothetical protein